MNNLTNNLEAMIYHQRQAEQENGNRQEWHYQQALRYRAMAYKLERQGRVLRQSVGVWMNLN